MLSDINKIPCSICKVPVFDHDDAMSTKCAIIAAHRHKEKCYEVAYDEYEAREAHHITQDPFFDSEPSLEALNVSGWQWARQFKDSADLCAMVYGPCGVGKTMAADRAARSIGGRVSYVQSTQFIRTMRLFDPEPDRTYWETAKVLLLDDFDKPEWTRRDASALWEILDSRQQFERKTILTMNVKPTELRALFAKSCEDNGSLFDSISERMIPACVVEFKGKSLRGNTTHKKAVLTQEIKLKRGEYIDEKGDISQHWS